MEKTYGQLDQIPLSGRGVEEILENITMMPNDQALKLKGKCQKWLLNEFRQGRTPDRLHNKSWRALSQCKEASPRGYNPMETVNHTRISRRAKKFRNETQA